MMPVDIKPLSIRLYHLCLVERQLEEGPQSQSRGREYDEDRASAVTDSWVPAAPQVPHHEADMRSAEQVLQKR